MPSTYRKPHPKPYAAASTALPRKGRPLSSSSKGSARERQVRKLLESEGWAVTRGAGSHGCADLWAAKAESYDNGRGGALARYLRLIQVKTDKAGPWANFRPKDRAELSALAAQTGGVAELWWWPPRDECRILREDSWPSA